MTNFQLLTAYWFTTDVVTDLSRLRAVAAKGLVSYSFLLFSSLSNQLL
jgi:hypothetical protein